MEMWLSLAWCPSLLFTTGTLNEIWSSSPWSVDFLAAEKYLRNISFTLPSICCSLPFQETLTCFWSTSCLLGSWSYWRSLSKSAYFWPTFCKATSRSVTRGWCWFSPWQFQSLKISPMPGLTSIKFLLGKSCVFVLFLSSTKRILWYCCVNSISWARL